MAFECFGSTDKKYELIEDPPGTLASIGDPSFGGMFKVEANVLFRAGDRKVVSLNS